MTRRVLLALATVALTLVTGGCNVTNLFLAFVPEVIYRDGVWTEKECVVFTGSPFEITSGKYRVLGSLPSGAPPPRLIKFRFTGFGADERRVGKRQVRIKVNDDGSIDDTVNNKKELALDQGDTLCIAIRPEGADIQRSSTRVAGREQQVVLNAFKLE